MKYPAEFKKFTESILHGFMLMRIIPVLFIAVVSMQYSYAQGCSDAGFCTINTFKPDAEDTIPPAKNHFKTGISHGAADHEITVIGVYAEYKRQFNNQISSDLKLTSLSQSGNGIYTFGLSDLFLNFNYSASEKSRFTFGIKIPLTDGNETKDGVPLPMDYQVSLGTFDLIASFGFKIDKLDLVLALQQPLTQNKNKFISEIYPEESLFSRFHSTNDYKRSGDVLLRISYPFYFSSHLKLTPGILPIYHLSNDKYTDLFGVEREIKGSQGLTLNANLFLDYLINRIHSMQLSFGAPLMVRDARPDGLTRSYVVNLEYRFSF